MSYETFMVSLPECRDWSTEPSHDPTNAAHADFGCSVQRDIGLVLANPADLAEPRARGPRDAIRSNVIVQRYRAGEVTISRRAKSETAAITEVAE